jgi:hypothetical protein
MGNPRPPGPPLASGARTGRERGQDSRIGVISAVCGARSPRPVTIQNGSSRAKYGRLPDAVRLGRDNHSVPFGDVTPDDSDAIRVRFEDAKSELQTLCLTPRETLLE